MTALVLIGLAVALAASPASAADNDAIFAKNTVVITGEAGGGWQDNLSPGRETGLEFFNLGLRVSLLPLDPIGEGALHGALEIGLEPFYQGYVEPRRALLGGMKAVTRYHFLSLGPVVPYGEILLGAGGTDLDALEINSTFAFILEGGGGLSYFLTDNVALSGGYRFQHVSNGNTSKPNRGFESHTAVVGVSVFLGKRPR